MPGIGVPAAAVFLAETLGKTSRHRRPPGLLPRPGTGDQEIGLIDPRRACHPRRQQAAHARRVPVRLRLPALRPRQPGLLPAQTRSGKASQPGRPRPGPPPHPDPARHDPGWSPLRSTTISTPTRSRLTHHIGVSRKTRPLRPDTRQTVTPTCHNPTHSTANDATQPNNERSRIAALRRQTALRWDTSSAGRTISTTHPDSPGPATSNAL